MDVEDLKKEYEEVKDNIEEEVEDVVDEAKSIWVWAQKNQTKLIVLASASGVVGFLIGLIF
jgi:uncharacterized membrane protein YdbT with pleckstrin-like domain